ncbi:hypothetical protein RH08_03455 [Candidatus Liberibacter asiaticus]|uniref:Uncharacterized protein n=2 Tax=Liberibacter asiaticus TaxID=34021 RepID=C6XF34_LIBAP|nr:hypothetical protein CLIBASIA_02000 [Candidatus Liberibacter asiaticus str. psy62]AGH17048.1 hypothetical protein WSI_03390 [Candidatus Liberibacter asiaticus str. gxpsy]ALK07373.1 hypothetical protein CD16_03415 [Candidatus Liberibacter asiaticus]BAP26568.1 hypothetical protein CGUJ_02000 [Candidatus Liberibacter asiaticus str. Ishi-1]ASK52865.1 hypothetical protein B2I23_03470 [Candidatus Liberibacter asiaticus]
MDKLDELNTKEFKCFLKNSRKKHITPSKDVVAKSIKKYEDRIRSSIDKKTFLTLSVYFENHLIRIF